MQSVFTQLSQYLAGKLDLLRVRAEQFKTDVDGGTLEPGGLSETENGMHLLDFRYSGVLLFERLPSDSLALLFALVVVWLATNDPGRARRNLDPPTVDLIELDDTKLYDVVITAEFLDSFHAGPSPDGAIEIGGVSYGLDCYELAVAERGDVNEAPTDV